MRKILFSLAALVLAFVATGCTDNSPKAAAEKVAQCMIDGDYEALADMVYIEAEDGKDIGEQRREIVELFKGFIGKAVEQKGGLKKVETLSEETSDDGQEAIVKQRSTYGNGDEMEDEMKLKRDGHGDWRLLMN